MTKTKMKTNHKPLVVTGYGLFGLLIIATFLSTTIPWGQMLVGNFARTSHYNIAVFLVALTIGAFLPILVGYIIGDHAVKSKDRISHHFNGVLFGLFAFWMMTLFIVLVTIPPELFATQPNTKVILVNILPSIGVAIITTIIAIAHVRSRSAKDDILTYRPFSIPFTASIFVLPLWSLVSGLMTDGVSINLFVPLVVVIGLGALSYATLRKSGKNIHDKLVWSAVSVSIFYVATFVFSQLITVISDFLLNQPTTEAYVLLGWSSFALAFIIWAIYWIKQVKALQKK